MKKAIIGSTLLLTGVLITMGIILTAGLYVPYITSWSGNSKLWFAILGAKQYGSDVVQSLFLGGPFVIGVILSIIGFIILALEYFNKRS